MDFRLEKHVVFPSKPFGCSSFCSQDSHFSDFVDKQTKYTTKCMITAPVMSGKEPIGVIMALNKQGAEDFSKNDQEVSGLEKRLRCYIFSASDLK